MPPQRRWTLMLVPDGCGNARTLSFTERAARRTLAVAAGVGIVAFMGSGVLVGRLSARVTHGGALAGSEKGGALAARLDSLADTISALARRDEQIRLLAGLPTENELDDESSLRGTLTGSGGTAMGALALDSKPDVGRMLRRANLLAASFAPADPLRVCATTPDLGAIARWAVEEGVAQRPQELSTVTAPGTAMHDGHRHRLVLRE